MTPGEYTFRVKGSNNDYVWNEEGISVKITITPPFWKTWWFRIPIIFAFLFSTVLWFRQRIRKIEAQKKMLEIQVKEKTKVAKELENTMDYLLQPENPERLKNALDKLESKAVSEIAHPPQLMYDDHLFLLINNQLKFVTIKSILGINAAGDYTDVITADGKAGLTQKSMKEWEERLPETYFIRIHRSTIINMEYVNRLEEWFKRSKTEIHGISRG